jgi:hypothetical protein
LAVTDLIHKLIYGRFRRDSKCPVKTVIRDSYAQAGIKDQQPLMDGVNYRLGEQFGVFDKTAPGIFFHSPLILPQKMSP